MFEHCYSPNCKQYFIASCLRRSCFPSNIKALQIYLLYLCLPRYYESGRKCTVTTSLLAYVNGWKLIEMFSPCNLLLISVTEWPFECSMITSTLDTQPCHFAITCLCSCPYTKKLFMRKSCVLGTESCTCMLSENS